MRLIEALWESYKNKVLPKDAPEIQISETRLAFYAGANGLFKTILNLLGPGEEPTDSDLRMMDEIDRELKDFIAQLPGRN